jgi:hypothetical protein
MFTHDRQAIISSQRIVVIISMVALLALLSPFPFASHSRAAYLENLVLRHPIAAAQKRRPTMDE